MINKSILVSLALFSIIALSSQKLVAQCGCTFTIPANQYEVNGTTLGVKPGDVICLPSGTITSKLFTNIVGTLDKPVIVKNCGGKSYIERPPTSGFGINFTRSKHFRLTGSGDINHFYGIEINGTNQGVEAGIGSSDFEIDHIQVYNTGYAGFAIKANPGCNPETWRENYTMYNVKIHDNYAHETTGESFYIGNSHYHFATGVDVTCSGVPIKVNEHSIRNCEVYNNIVENSGRDGIQVAASIEGGKIYNNSVKIFGLKNPDHINGIQLNPGFVGQVYNNYVTGGVGYGIQSLASAATIFNNILTNCAAGGIFVDDRVTFPGSTFNIFNNTLVKNGRYGIYFLSLATVNNKFYNNIIVSDGSGTFKYVSKHPSAQLESLNNYQTADINSVQFEDPSAQNFKIKTGSPVIDAGRDVSAYGVSFDFGNKPRPINAKFDQGAYELQSQNVTSNAGLDISITLPTNSVTLNGSGTSPTGITGYLWTKKTGGAATLANTTTTNLSVSGMTQGTYVFELRVTDANGFAFDEVTVNVLPAATNQNPIAEAGTNKTITLPTNSIILNGSGTDADGFIASYLWTKISGPTASLTNANTPNLNLSSLLEGIYVFQLSVTDNNSATASDQVTVAVNPAATNIIPLVNAGTQKTIFLPINQVIITATASDPDGSISSIQWEKKSGGVATLTNANTLTVTISGLVAGIYSFRITVTDNNNATAFSEVTVNVLLGNQSPTANAGLDQFLTLPTNSIVLSGSGNDPDGSIVGYAWTKVSGPSASLTNTNTATLNVTSMLQGVYVFSLIVTDNDGATASDLVTVSVDVTPTGPNEVPLAIAGGNISFSLPTNSVNLYGSGFDPDGSIVSYLWAKSSGGGATLANTDKPTLTVSNLQAGQYSFRLTVTDDDGATDDDLAIITISNLGTNLSPIASAGADKIVKLPNTSVTLDGSGVDEDGQIVSYLWTQLSGTSTTITSPSEPITTVTGLALGEYSFRLRVTDNLGATDINDAIVRVVSSTNNLPPSVDAGLDIKIFTPQNTLTINSIAEDDGTIVLYQWVKLGGPSVTLNNPTEQNLSLSNLVEGEYTFMISVTDNNGASIFDIVKVSVLPNSFTPPIVNAGSDQQIALPINQINLTGTASSSTSTVVSTSWAKTSGPTATLTGTSTLALQVTNMVVGTYIFTLTVIDNNGKEASDNVQVVVNPVQPNQNPIANAGGTLSLTLPIANPIVIKGSGTDSDGTIVSYNWTQINGPQITLQGTTTSDLTISNITQDAAYTIRLTITDNEGATGFDDLLIIVFKSANDLKIPPIVSAGPDRIVLLPENSIEIVGIGSDEDGIIESFSWDQIAGPSASISTPTENMLLLSELSQGQYEFSFTVMDDDSLKATDQVMILVTDDGEKIIVPKYFSPNNDGQNDTWVIGNLAAISNCLLQIFTREGKNVYETTSYDNSWGGVAKDGKVLTDGDYYYIITCDGTKVGSGGIRIIR
jgi:gliding motility-associated-like protein